jgi:hypothetical protein
MKAKAIIILTPISAEAFFSSLGARTLALSTSFCTHPILRRIRNRGSHRTGRNHRT